MKTREMSREECEDLLSKCRFGRLGLSLDDKPYVIPLSYVYSDGVLYLHSGLKGKKLDMAKKNPQACFEVDSLEDNRWKSVVVSGKANLSDSLEAKQKVFDVFIKSKMGGHGGQAFRREDLEKMPMCIWEIEVEDMTGRQGVW
jgi:nitroimidazol reductase NimA-like FMN-containing flavoprotein (pyridoxamine 5'-phosphate oxidase superfamily)